MNTAAGRTKRLALGDGWHTLAWPEPKRPGLYPVHVTAVDWAANRASFDALPIVRATAAGTATVARRIAASTRSAGTGVAVGAALDDLSQAGALQKLGLRLARIGVTWPAGAPTPDPTVTTALQSLPAGLGSVLELNASPLPADDAGRAALAQYAATLAQQTPGLQSLVLAPAPTTATAGAYALAYDDIRAALLDAAPDVQVGIRIDGALAPKATLTALGAVLPQLVAFHPAPAPGNGLWTTTDVTKLITALTASAGTAPPVLLDGPPAPTAALISSLGCGDQVAGILLDQLSQATAPLLAAAASARRGALVCPGVATQVQATGVTYPTAATAPLSVAIRLRRRLSLPAHARRAERPTRRSAPRRATRRRCARDDRAAVGEARRRALPRRPPPRRLGQPRPHDRAREPAARLGDGPAHGVNAPRRAGGEQLVGVDLAQPAEEMRLGIVVGGAVDGRPPRVELQVEIVAALERGEPFLDRAPFRVPFAHPGRVLPPPFPAIEGR